MEGPDGCDRIQERRPRACNVAGGSMQPGRAEKSSVSPTRRPAWTALSEHYRTVRKAHLRELFAEDPGRGERLTAEAAGIYLDYSKNRVTDETMRLLVELAAESGVPQRRDAMFRGEHINVSEDRAVLHVALRMPATESLIVDG